MANHGNAFPKGSRPRGTLRIKRLLTTQLKLMRLEIVGQDHPFLVRAGALLICGPILLVGYAFALAAAVRLLAIRIGWGGGLLLVGIVHLLVGAWGLRRARALAFAESYDVLAPECETEGAATGRFDFDNAVTLPSVHAPSRSHGAGLH
ncbi:MAG TPA: hypothetical protein VIK30_09020 [Polyangia bacterium]